MKPRLATLLPFSVLWAGLPAQHLQLDATRAFYASVAPGAVVAADTGIVAETAAGAITDAAFVRYVHAHREPGRGRRLLEDLGFLFVLARECEARGIARSAPALAPAMAARPLPTRLAHRRR